MLSKISQYDAVYYQSDILTSNGNSGVIAFGAGWEMGYIFIEGAGLTTDETLDLTVDFCFDSNGDTIDTSNLRKTFAQLTASVSKARVALPGGMSSSMEFLPPFVKLSWTLGGSTKSMSFLMRRFLRGQRLVPESAAMFY